MKKKTVIFLGMFFLSIFIFSIVVTADSYKVGTQTIQLHGETYSVQSRTGNESLYDVTFNQTSVFDHSYLITHNSTTGALLKNPINVSVNRTDTIICLEAGWDNKQVVTYFYDNNYTIIGTDKNYTYSVPSTLSFYKNKTLVKQTSLTKTKTNSLSATTPSNPNRFCYQANPYKDFYLKFGDNSIIVIQDSEWISTSLLTNVTAEGGVSNFTHLNISSAAPYDNLTGYWSFDGDRENELLTTHYDFTTNNNDGTGVNQTAVNSSGCIGTYGKCLHLDGDGDYILVANEANFDFGQSDPFSISIWLFVIGNQFATQIINKQQVGGGAPGYTFSTRGGTSSPKLNFLMGGDTGLFQQRTTNDLPMNTWYHAVLVYNGNGSATGVSFFVNGAAEGSFTLNDITPIGNALNNDNPRIGRSVGGTGSFNGSIDEVMIFGTNLSAAQVLAIYNNQSARFFETGTQDIVNQSILNISTGNDRVNVSTTIQNNSGSVINLTVGFYNGSWLSTASQIVVSDTNMTFIIDNASTNLTLNYTFIAGNSTTSFYSPLILGDIFLETFSSVADTCTYTSGNWAIDCADDCSISSPVNLLGNDISIIGIGTLTISALINNWSDLFIKGVDATNRCDVTCLGGECFE